MELNKNDLKSDALGNLYRSAFYMAKNQPEIAFNFLNKACLVLKDDLSKNIRNLSLAKHKFSNTKKQNTVLAEGILDEFLRLRKTS